MFEWLTKAEKIADLEELCKLLKRKLELAEGVCMYQKQLLANQQKTLTRSPLQESDKKTLLKLCHPDKHGGDKQAEEIFKKINQSWK